MAYKLQRDGADRRILQIRALRAEVEAAVAGNAPLPPHRRLINLITPLIAAASLSELQEAIEAEILLNVLHQKRASRTVKLMSQLRRLRRDAFDPEGFDRFQARMNELLHPAMLTSHGYATPLGAHDPGRIWASLAARTAELTGLPDVFLNSGTLLGMVRENRLLPHDDDIDLAVTLKADSPQAAAAEWIATRDRLAAVGLIEDDAQARRKAKVIKLRPIDGIDVDLFPCWIEADRVYVYPHCFGTLSRDDLLPLRPSTINGFIPAAPEKMLEGNYGKGWRIPDPYFTFDWPRANARFATFDAALARLQG